MKILIPPAGSRNYKLHRRPVRAGRAHRDVPSYVPSWCPGSWRRGNDFPLGHECTCSERAEPALEQVMLPYKLVYCSNPSVETAKLYLKFTPQFYDNVQWACRWTGDDHYKLCHNVPLVRKHHARGIYWPYFFAEKSAPYIYTEVTSFDSHRGLWETSVHDRCTHINSKFITKEKWSGKYNRTIINPYM